MTAIDTVYTDVTDPGSAWTATSPANGDSLSVRNFPNPGSCYLLDAWRRGVTAGPARVRSPRLHDNVSGINWYSAETVDTLGLPREMIQPLVANDTLITEVQGGTAEYDAVVLLNYYSSLPGSDARLASWGDISGILKSLKAFYTVGAAGAHAWTDTVITTTDNQLHANTDYAVLGYSVGSACGAFAVKGQETGNLHIGGPGTTQSLVTRSWFLDLANDTGMPAIPVFNANNRASFYVSAADVAAIATLDITLYLAELSQPAPV